MFTYENSIPVCAWISTQECRILPCIIDERVCGDTFFKVERLSNNEFVVSDIWMYNSNCVFACSTFQQRYEWLRKFIPMIHTHSQGTIKLIHKSELKNHNIRGYEEYTNEIGKYGFFIDKNLMKIKKLPLPDCYQVGESGYLLVPDLKTSEFLRSLGNEFELPCERVDDESWKITTC